MLYIVGHEDMSRSSGNSKMSLNVGSLVNFESRLVKVHRNPPVGLKLLSVMETLYIQKSMAMASLIRRKNGKKFVKASSGFFSSSKFTF
ncbi:hypothetical protein EG68_04587 [Paragonimus skrjabini miyazakii]|uniref:Uncharacterized protein n=1 Tax=Paragonimus skrjabini miyazakii TaxID=59628 RepID=A0A8S9YX21_9TREM|nr:hypothetical protein EG68_04587 [Paragonimus skrjabini miyazakii]